MNYLHVKLNNFLSFLFLFCAKPSVNIFYTVLYLLFHAALLKREFFLHIFLAKFFRDACYSQVLQRSSLFDIKRISEKDHLFRMGNNTTRFPAHVPVLR